MNKAILAGRLGRDPEMRSTSTGGQVASFSMATGSGDYTEWHNIVAFKDKADLVDRFLKKGSTVIVEGRLQTRKWKHKDGSDRYTTEVIVRDLYFTDSKSERSEMVDQNSDPDTSINDEDIPF